jgi:hypothetical protein
MGTFNSAQVLYDENAGFVDEYVQTECLPSLEFERMYQTSVADPACLSRIRIFPSRIQVQKDIESRIWIRIKELKYF